MKHIQFYYVRHGETIFNVKNLSQGSCDSPLTKNGIHQAEKTKEKIKDIGYISKMVNSRNRINEKIIFLHVSNTEEICDLMHSFLD